MDNRKKILSILIMATAALLAGHQLTAGNDEISDPALSDSGPSNPVVVELFTSQGCSSCPPADRLLSRLGADGEDGAATIIPLSFHVDYWNYIGWNDPFSSAEWSRRQSSYAKSFDSGRVYTPQLVVNGRRDCVGSNEAKVRQEIERAAREGTAGQLELKLNSGTDTRILNLEIEALLGDTAAGDRWAVMVAVFENELETPVSRGENGGRKLHNSHVVRTLTKAFSLPARPGTRHSGEIRIELDREWQREHLGIAVFLQDPVSRHIHGAAVRYLSV